MIVGFVRGQRLRLLTPPVAAGTFDALPARFVFETGEWAGLSKYAHFMKGEDRIDVPIPENGEIGPAEGHINLSAGEWTVWVHGDAFENGVTAARMTTAAATLVVRETGAEDPLPLPPTYGEQVLALAASVKEETEELLSYYREFFTALAAKAEGSAGVIFNRRDLSPLPVWAGSEEDFASLTPSDGWICLVGLFGEGGEEA